MGLNTVGRLGAVWAMALVAGFGPAAADDAPFLNTDPASVLPKGGALIQQWASWAHGHTGESYNAFETLTEFDYGLTDRIQIAGTLAYDWDRTRPPGGPATSSGLVGFQGELIYLLAPYDTSPLDVAIAIDPAVNPSTRGIAVRLLLTKYLWGFEHVLNVNFENGWDKDDVGHWDEGGTVELNYGIGYAIDKHWTVGLEVGNQFTFSRLVTAVDFANTGTTVFFGPTVEYDCETTIVTLGVQAQLPLAGGGNVVNGYRVDAERWRAGLRISRSI